MFKQVFAVFPVFLVVTIALLECEAAIDYNTSSTTADISSPAEDSSPSTSIVTTDTESSPTSATLASGAASNPSSSLTPTTTVNGTTATVQSTTEGFPTTSPSSTCETNCSCNVTYVRSCPCQNEGTCFEVDAGTPIARKICLCPYGYGGHSCEIERTTKAALMYSLWWIVVISLGSLAFAAIRHSRQTKLRPHDPHERFVDVLNRAAAQPSNNS